MPKKSRAKGDRWEREVAAIVGGKRGNAFSGEPDVSNETYLFEVKVRKSLPKWILEAIETADSKRKATGLAPVVVIGQSRVGQKPILLFCHPSAFEWVEIHGQG